MNSNYEDLLRMFLQCGSLDLSVLDGIEYDLCEIVDDLRAEGINPTLNAITNEVFYKGQMELSEAVENAISKRREEQEAIDEAEAVDTDPAIEEYNLLQSEIDDLEMLNPEEDMGWYCNCLDTSCWFDEHESIYRKYLADEIRVIENRMGFEF